MTECNVYFESEQDVRFFSVLVRFAPQAGRGHSRCTTTELMLDFLWLEAVKLTVLPRSWIPAVQKTLVAWAICGLGG